MSSENLKISIITINYNNATGLEKTIQSILSQTYKNIEYLIIDGGSGDGSREILERYTADITFWVSEKDSGIYNAMNKGILKSGGEYLLFMNSGDIFVDQLVVSDVVNSGLTEDLVYGDVYAENELRRKSWCPSPKLTFNVFFRESIPHQSTFIRRSLFDIVGLYNEQLKIVSDWEFSMLAVCKYQCSYRHINRFIALFMEDGISSDPKNYAVRKAERYQVFEKYFPSFIEDYEQLEALEHEMRRLNFARKSRHFIKRFIKAIGFGPSASSE